MKPKPLPLDDLIAALARPTVGPDGGRTAGELETATGLHRLRVLAFLRKLSAEDKLIVTRVARPAIDGALRRVPVYSLRSNGKQP